MVRQFAGLLDGYLAAEQAQITAAARWANRRHAGQLRASGEPFIVHPLEVAAAIVSNNMDRDSIVAALLHDVVEDTELTMGELEAEFDSEVRGLVEGVTKISVIKGDESHRAAGRVDPQDVVRDGARHTRHPDQTRR